MTALNSALESLKNRLNVDLAQRVVILLFMVVILAPLTAIIGSPIFRVALGEMVKNPSQRAVQIDALRRSTTLLDTANKFYSTTLYYLGVSSNPGMGVVGRDGWVFLGDAHQHSFSQSIHQRVLLENEVSNWTNSLRRINEWLGRRHIPLVFVVAPSSGTIYPEKLPAWATARLAQPSSFDRVLADGRDLPLIDVRSELKAAKAIAATYSPLNSHWTDFGAAIAWRKVAAELRSRLPGFQPFAADAVGNITLMSDARGLNEYLNLIGISAPNPWTVFEPRPPLPDYDIVDPNGSTHRVPGATTTGLHDLPRETLNRAASNDLTAMVFRDSMGTSISPFIQASFRRTVQLNHHVTQYPKDRINLIPAVEKYRPDVIIYIMTERYFDLPLASTFYWYSVDLFDSAPSDNSLVWTREGAAKSNLTVQGDLTLRTQAKVAWRLEAADPGSYILRLNLLSGGYGVVRLKYTANGQTGELYEEYYEGQNQLFFWLPKEVDRDSITISRSGVDLAEVELRDVTLRSRKR